MHQMTFKDSKVEMITLEGEVWVRGVQIGEVLGYSNPRDRINELYQRHKDEFTDSMTRLISLPDLHPQTAGAGQVRQVRIFSLRGAHLLAMFARTPKAKAFRRWVLDILDSLHKGGEYVMEQYRKANSEYEEGKKVASKCGKGLNHWKQAKTPLQLRKLHWQERQQLCLALG